MNDNAGHSVQQGFPADDILDFWLVRTAPEKRFAKDADFDASIRQRFGDVTAKAIAGEYHSDNMSHREQLALIIVLDQFARNLHRGHAKAFAGDALALQLAKALLRQDARANFSDEEKASLYLPLEHSENLADQELCVQLYTELGNDKDTRYAVMHRDIIRRFGRFPHRNEALGRNSTAEELAFLNQPNSSF